MGDLAKKVLTAVLLFSLVGVGASCSADNYDYSVEAKTGTLNVMVTDAPPGYEIVSIEATISSVKVHKASAEQEEEQQQQSGTTEGEPVTEQEQEQEQAQEDEGEWIELSLVGGGETFTFDLLAVSGLEELMATDELEVGVYTQARLTVDSIVVTYIEEGETEELTVTAEVPSGEIKFVRPFEIEEGIETTLLLDFDANKSVTFTGNGKVNFKPVIKLTIQ